MSGPEETTDKWLVRSLVLPAVISLLVSVVAPLIVHRLTTSPTTSNLRLADVSTLELPFDGGTETALDIRLENDGDIAADVTRFELAVVDISHFSYSPTPCPGACLPATGPPMTAVFAEDLGSVAAPKTLAVQSISVSVDAHADGRIVLPFGVADRNGSYLARVTLRLDADHGRSFAIPARDILVIRDPRVVSPASSTFTSFDMANSLIDTAALAIQDRDSILQWLKSGNITPPAWYSAG